MEEFLGYFYKAYDFLYDHDELIDVEQNLVDIGDRWLEEYPDLVKEYNKETGEILTSDREVAAFAVACSLINGENEMIPDDNIVKMAVTEPEYER